MRLSRPICFLLLLLLTAAASAQNWPGKIAGYKLYDPKITVTGRGADGIDVRVVSAKVKSVGLAGTTVAIEAAVSSQKQGADIDFIRFKDILVNGIAIEPEEYRHAFALKKGETLSLSAPFLVKVPATSQPRAIYDQLRSPSARLRITGTVFIFGRFKKLGFQFKRVAPIRLDMEIENPIHFR